MPEAWIGLGSNLGNRREHLRKGVIALRGLGEVHHVSSLYETEPVGFADQGPFLNAVVCLETQLSPQSLLAELLRIEASQGRVRKQADGPRTLDLDLLFYGADVIREPGLEVPHPRLHERRFVLVPLHQLAPRLIHPVLNRSIGVLLGSLADHAAVVEVQQHPAWLADEKMRFTPGEEK